MSDFQFGLDAMQPFADAGQSLEVELSYRAKAEHAAKAFAEYITTRGYTRLYRPELNPDTVADVAHVLHREAFEPTLATLIVHPIKLRELQDNLLERHHTLQEKNECHDIEIQVSKMLPENRCVAVHPEAITPDNRANSFKPWLITQPKGIVPVILHE